MDKHHITIDIAAYGLESEPWQGFYPADLPEDWRLDFYCNEFRAVVVPIEIWQKIDADDLEEWQENAHEQFRFYFEKNSKSVSDSVNEMIESLGAQWGGWICHEDERMIAVPLRFGMRGRRSLERCESWLRVWMKKLGQQNGVLWW